MTDQDRQRLVDLMEARRAELRLTWRQVAVTAGVTEETIRQVRFGGRPIRDTTRRGIETAMRWTPGSAARVLAGGALPTAGQDRPTGSAPETSGEVPRELIEALDAYRRTYGEEAYIKAHAQVLARVRYGTQGEQSDAG